MGGGGTPTSEKKPHPLAFEARVGGGGVKFHVTFVWLSATPLSGCGHCCEVIYHVDCSLLILQYRLNISSKALVKADAGRLKSLAPEPVEPPVHAVYYLMVRLLLPDATESEA